MSNTRTQSKPLPRLKPMVEWKDTNWRKLERVVFKLQKRIYQASSRGDVKAVRKLQKTLMRSWSAKMLAVRRVTQDNQGKVTAGVDGKKSLTPKQRLELVSKLRLNQKAKSTRRVWIPKPGTEERRIPSILRGKQLFWLPRRTQGISRRLLANNSCQRGDDASFTNAIAKRCCFAQIAHILKKTDSQLTSSGNTLT